MIGQLLLLSGHLLVPVQIRYPTLDHLLQLVQPIFCHENNITLQHVHNMKLLRIFDINVRYILCGEGKVVVGREACQESQSISLIGFQNISQIISLQKLYLLRFDQYNAFFV